MKTFPSASCPVSWRGMTLGLALVVVFMGSFPATSVADFTILGTDGVWLQQNSRVTSGDVGANIVSPGPFLSDGVELTFGPGARVDTAASVVYGNRISLNISAQVFDVHTNQASGIGTILGQTISPLTLPVVGTLPPIPSIAQGTQPVNVLPFTTQSLGPGSYGAVTVGSAGTLTLTGGTYEIASLTVGNSAKVHVAAPSELRIAGKLQTDPIARIEPAPGTTLTAADILIVVTGQNGTSGGLSESPKAVSFGQATTVRAKVWAPNGTVELQQNSVGTGAFLGKWVILGPGVFAHFEGGFGLTVGGAGNSPPVAHAGFNQSVTVGETVELNGSGSTDEDGDALTFVWSLISQPAGSSATLTTPTKVLPSLTIDQPGDYVVQLLVNDGMVDSDPDTVTLSTGNVAPHANAGPDQTGVVTQDVFLDGTHSTDANGDGLTYQWTLVTKPAGSAAVLNDPTSPTPSFTVDQAGTYTVNLIVSDGLLPSESDTVIIDTTNSKPVANAGPDHTVRAGTPITLDGTSSNDVDGNPLTYHWVQTVVPPGNTATLSDPTAAAPTLTPNVNGEYVVQLQVNDGLVTSEPDTALLRSGNTAPKADAGHDQTVPVGATVQLNGTNSNDPQNDSLTYQWTLISPAGSTATLSDATVAQPTFVADLPGTYAVTLIVNDGDLDSDPDAVTVITQNNPPVANAGLDQTVPVGATVHLNGTGSSDPEGQPLSFQWSLVSTPGGSTATLGNPTSVTPTFVADVAGTYVVQLIVDDGLAPSPPDTVTVTATNNAPPVANAGADQRTLAGTTIFFNGTGSSDPNGDPLTYQWTLFQKPTGSGAVVSDATTVSASLVPDVNGLYVLQLVVHDGVVTSQPDTVTLTVGNTPPVLNPLGNQVIPLGQLLTFPLTGSDADGDPITFTAAPVVLPTHMVFNSTTGLVTFQPDASQVGNHVVTFGIQDGFAGDTETITITVQAPGPGSVTGLTGRLLDTNDFVNGGTETPVVGATVSLLGTGISVTSDAQGLFTLSGLPAGLQVLDIDVSTATPGPGGVTYAGFRERLDLIPNATKVIDRPFFLPRNDPNSAMTVNGVSVTGVDPTQTTIVTNPALSATLTVPPHTAMMNGVEYTGPLSISEVPEGLAPAALPATLKPELLITIQPPGVTFTQALKLTLANREGLATGNDMNLWSLDPEAGAFEVVGVGRISGGLINTISGGVRAADWHGLFPPGVGVGGAGNGSGAQNGNQGSDKPKKKCGSSEIALCTGGLTEVHDLVPYRSLGIERGVQLVYNSRTAEPYVVIEEEAQIPVQSAVPERVSMGVTVGVPRLNIQRGVMIPTAPGSGPAGLQIGPPVFFDTSGLSETVIHQFRLKHAWPVADLATGSYPVRVNLTNHFPATLVGIDMYETITINNQQGSPFGAGWSVAGVDRLHLQENGDVVLAQGQGGTQLFRQAKPGSFLADEEVFLNGNNSNPRKVLLADLTNDGIPDLGIPTTFAVPGRLEVHQGLGNGQFQFVTESTVGPQMASALTADFDEDGLLDLVAASTYLSGFATVAYGDGTGAMQNPFTLAQGTNTPAAKFVGSVTVADVNQDGHQDIAIAYTVANVVDVHLGTGLRGPSGFGPPITSVVVTGSPADLKTADVNQDGHLDLVTANNTSLSVLWGDGTGAFSTLLPLTGLQFALTVEVMDLNGDGYPDLVTTGNGITQNDRIAVFENTRAGGFWAPTILTLPTGFRPSNIATGDVTGDGAVDLVVETQGNGFGLAVIHGDGFGGFGTPQIIPIGKKPLTLALGDVDGNGTLDALASIQGLTIGTDHVQVFRNPAPGEGFVSPPGEFSTLTLNPDDTYTQRLKTGTVIQFDATGRQTSVTDRNGNVTTYGYDGQDRLLTITDPANLVTTFAYPGGQVTITDPVGRITRLGQDSQGNLTTMTDPDLTTRTFTYDAHHLMTAQVNQRGFRTQYVYNDFHQVVQTLRADHTTNGFTPARSLGLVAPGGTQGTASNPLPLVMEAQARSTLTDGKGQVTTMGFDAFGADTIVTDALGRTTTTTRNDAGLPISITTPNGALTELTYDPQGNLLTRREAKNLFGLDRTTSFQYDPVFNQLTKVTDPDNKVTTIQLDANGNPLVVINPLNGQRLRTFTSQGQVLTDRDENGKTTTFTYYPNGNLETLTDAEGHVTRFVRDAAGNVTSLIEGEGTPEQRTRTFTYDPMNRLTSATDGTVNPPTQFAYDAQGNLTTTTLPTGEQEVRTYDPLNRVATINDPLRGLTTFTYDANGNLLASVNALNDPTMFAYDAADQLATITDALTGLQAFGYDVEGNVQTFTDARGKVTTFEYDKLNRQTKRLAPGGTFTTTFTYDKRDNLKTTLDPKNQLITRVYDNNSRLTSITTPDNTITLGYDPVGNPTGVTDADSQVTFTYDGLNRTKTALTSQSAGIQPQVLLTSVYDAVGNRRQLQEDGGSSTSSYLYDLAGRLTTLTPPAGPSMNVTLGYDPSGRLASIAYPNGVVSAYGYDTRGRLTSLSHTQSANPSFASFGYTYNPVGNLLAILDQVNPAENRTQTYDVLQRLTTGGTTGTPESYNYDLVGNRTSSFLSTTHTHNDLNRLLEDDSFLYTYDNNGNLATKTNKATPTEVTTYHWDAQDQLTQINLPNSTTVTYKYDGLGRRIEKNVAGSITRYVYDGEDILLEYDGSNTFLARYSHGDQVDQPLILQKAGLGFFYYHSNHQGSITQLTNSSGTVANSYVYDSYGRRLSVFESVIQPYSYTGREYDEESGLYYYRARYFDANTGRFLSEDPIGFKGQDANFYRYVFNNPTNGKDPSGNFGLGGFGIGAGLDLLNQLAQNGGNFGCLDFGSAFRSGLLGALGGVGGSALRSAATKFLPAAKQGIKEAIQQFKKHILGKPYPTKANRGGQQQPYDPKNGQFKPYAANQGPTHTSTARFTSGLVQGYAAAHGATGGSPPVGLAGQAGYIIGNVAGNFF